MSVDKIKGKILSDAQAEALRIEVEIAEKVKKIKEEQQGRIETIKKDAEEEGRRLAEDRRKKDIAAAELELRKAFLAQKQELIQTVFDRALERLANLEGKEYERFIAELLLKAVEEGDEEVLLSSGDGHKIGDKFLDEVNRKLNVKGKKGALRLVREDRDLGGGFILRRGKKEINCSMASLFNTVREELEPAVAKILFS